MKRLRNTIKTATPMIYVMTFIGSILLNVILLNFFVGMDEVIEYAEETHDSVVYDRERVIYISGPEMGHVIAKFESAHPPHLKLVAVKCVHGITVINDREFYEGVEDGQWRRFKIMAITDIYFTRFGETGEVKKKIRDYSYILLDETSKKETAHR